MDASRGLGWFGIARLGLVQAALGAVVVLTTSTLNRVMVVELALPALLPGLLVALHHAVQVSRPRMGFGSDVGGRSTPWIMGGMAVLALGGFGAALGTVLMGTQRGAGIALAVLSFALVGLGVSAAGTSLLVLLAKRVIHFSRIDLRPIEEDIYGPDGQVQTQTSYGSLVTFGTERYPGTITIKWPLQEQQILITFQKLVVNQPLNDEQFQMTIPEGTPVQKLP